MIEVSIYGKWEPHFDESGGTLTLNASEIDHLITELLNPQVREQGVIELSIGRDDEEEGEE